MRVTSPGHLLAPILLMGTLGCAANPKVSDVPPVDCAVPSESDRLPDGRDLLQAYDSLSDVVATSGRSTPVKLDPLVPFTSPPRLANAPVVQTLLQQLYPPALRDTDRGGKTMLALLIGSDGAVQQVRVVRTSGYSELDQASTVVARRLHFQPARNRSCAIPFFAQMPMSWVVERH